MYKIACNEPEGSFRVLRRVAMQHKYKKSHLDDKHWSWDAIKIICCHFTHLRARGQKSSQLIKSKKLQKPKHQLSRKVQVCECVRVRVYLFSWHLAVCELVLLINTHQLAICQRACRAGARRAFEDRLSLKMPSLLDSYHLPHGPHSVGDIGRRRCAAIQWDKISLFRILEGSLRNTTMSGELTFKRTSRKMAPNLQ